MQEKENTVQATKEELNTVRSKSSTEIDDAKKRLESTEEKVQKLEDEVFTANKESSRVQAEVQKYEKEIVPTLRAVVSPGRTLRERLLAVFSLP